jgi:hypothetical protein
MPSDFPQKVVEYIDGLIQMAETALVRATEYIPVSTTHFQQVALGCSHLGSILGDSLNHWSTAFMVDDTQNYVNNLERLLGNLRALKFAIATGVLQSLAELARAEAFGDLLEQADYLLSEGYSLPSAVIGRAVLEEHLRKWCDQPGLTPSKPRPTIEDFRQSLYAAKQLDKVKSALVSSMATVGNNAAHGIAVDKADVERLLRDLRSFIATAKP